MALQVSYNGYSVQPTFRERVVDFVTSFGRERKSPAMPALPPGGMVSVNPTMPTWSPNSPASIIRNQYKVNSAIATCVAVWNSSFGQASLKAFDKVTRKPIPDHPFSIFMEQPNEDMGQDEYWNYDIPYRLLGGNCYGQKVRSKANLVAEIWPYHFGKIMPVPVGNSWIDHYLYDLGNGQKEEIPKADIVHTKWIGGPDPEKPWYALSPLGSISREVDSDNELTRFVKSILENDAVPSGLIQGPAGGPPGGINELRRKQIKQDWRREFGGDRRGDIAILEGGYTYQRVSLSFAELQTQEFRDSIEARVAGAFRVPPQVAYLTIGVRHQVYNNYREARYAFTYGTLIPLWRSTAAAYNRSVLPEFGDPRKVYADFDLTEVESIKETQSDLKNTLMESGSKGFLTVNEVRLVLGYPAVEGGDVRLETTSTLEQFVNGLVKVSSTPDAPAPKAHYIPGLPTGLDVTKGVGASDVKVLELAGVGNGR